MYQKLVLKNCDILKSECEFHNEKLITTINKEHNKNKNHTL